MARPMHSLGFPPTLFMPFILRPNQYSHYGTLFPSSISFGPTAALLTVVQTDPTHHPHYTVKDGLLFYKDRVYVAPKSAFHPLILTEFHNSPIGGHAGSQRTLARLASTFYWPNMRQSVRDFVAKCSVCSLAKPFNTAPQGLLQPLPIPGKIWDSISMDFITHLPPSSNKTTILVVVDRLSKHAHFSALGTSFSAPQVADIFVKDIVKLHGFPSSIVSDRDSIFISLFWQTLFKLQGTSLALSSTYHPQSDGQTEVLNRYLEDYLRCFVSDHPRQWLQYLPWAEWHYNTAWHSAIQMTPFQAVFGRAPPSLLDYISGTTDVASVDSLLQNRDHILRTLKGNLHRAQTRMRTQANSGRRDVTFHEGDWVFLRLQPYRQSSLTHRQTNKLSMRFFGPFQITAKIGPVAYKLDLPPTAKIHNVFHVSKLKKCHGDPLTQGAPLPLDFIGHQPLLKPATILDSRQILSQGISTPQLLVQWENQPVTDATWESLADFKRDFPHFNLEDKVGLDGRRIDASPSSQVEPTRRSTRDRRLPAKLSDYV